MSLGIPGELKREVLRILDELADGNTETLQVPPDITPPRTANAIRHLLDKSAFWYEGGTNYRLTASGWDYRYRLKYPLRYWIKGNVVAVIAVAALIVSVAGIFLD